MEESGPRDEPCQAGRTGMDEVVRATLRSSTRYPMLAAGPPVAMANDSGPPATPSSSTSSSSSLSPSPTPSVARPSPVHIDNGPFSPRGLKQLGLFFAGASFLVCSTLITKRAVTRKKLAALPKFYQPSHAAAGKQENPEGSLIALEALNLATLNVFSFAVMATGGVAWAFDVSSVDDLREKARRTIRGEAGKTDEAAEREFEEWATRVLTKLGQTPAAEENSSQGKPSASEKKD
ncbi:hypothetical protein VDGE_02526 [Verticillium dahliae]|uniref:Altered inheritance of mitochondria protein 11 n=1 Tax=Verticillium dahliae TaxID=27337 RepID=A0A444RUF5_VERDA|nr:hypothetical protein VDGE_02526 [Verticillium dahliae]